MMELNVHIPIKKTLVISEAENDFLSDGRILGDSNFLINLDYASIESGSIDYYNFFNHSSNSGLLIRNGGLVYPPNSTSIKEYYKRFESCSQETLSHFTFQIDHTGTASDWLTDSETGGTPTLNYLNFEFLIKRIDGTTFGWYNPFAVYNSPYGVASTSINRSGLLTTVSCTLATNVRVSFDDLVLVKVRADSEWNGKIRNIKLASNNQCC